MPGKFLHRTHVALREVEGGGNSKMTEPMRTNCETGKLRAELAHDVIDRIAREASPFAGAVEVDE